MSDDLRTRVAEALCENAGMSWHTTWAALRDGFLEEADAVLCVLDGERAKLRDLLRSEKERADAAIKREETAEEHASEIGQYARRMEQERDTLREAHAKAVGDAAYWRHSWEQDKGPDVDELKATIVSQAREIARLKGESA